MLDDNGQQRRRSRPRTAGAGPRLAVAFPQAGDEFRVLEDEREARQIATEREHHRREAEIVAAARRFPPDLARSDAERARSPSSTSSSRPTPKVAVEALDDQLDKMDQSLVKINIIRKGAGGITENDVTLAQASDAIVIGFNVVAERAGRHACGRSRRRHPHVPSHLPSGAGHRERGRGSARTRDPRGRARPGRGPRNVQGSAGSASIAGCMVLDGVIRRNSKAPSGARRDASSTKRPITSLRRFKDDVREVAAGYECGIGLEGFQDVKEGRHHPGLRDPRGRSLTRRRRVHRHRSVRDLHPGERAR